ncbi:MAG TPA: DUF1109 domain-containing protein [Burkholderiales bacterium]|nr:DUF1109 domain-containing protein [Burkholderiales bacterium]
MRTDELVSLLASGETAVDPRTLQRRYAIALGWGAFGATLLMALLLGVRPDLPEAARLPMFWVKLAFPATLLAGALLATARLSRPGMRVGRVAAVLAAPVLAIWLLAFVALLNAVPEEWEALVFGDTWTECLINIPVLSVPAFVAVFWAVRGLAPTRLALAGGAAGLLAGAIGALSYALHCPEMAAPFLGIWYLLGMLIPTAAGAFLGLRLLRW